MGRNWMLMLAGLCVGALVVAFVFVPAVRGQGPLVAVVLGFAGLLVLGAAVGASLPRPARSTIGWTVLVACPIALLAWIFTVGVPPGAGTIVLGAIVCVTALAGLVLALR